MSIEVSVVIVSYNTCAMTRKAIESVLRETCRNEYEVIVLDNSSKDGSVDMIRECFADVHLIESKENLGFGVGNNKAVQFANGKYLLLLNPDTVVLEQAVDRLVEFANEHPLNGIYGGRTFFGDGSLNPMSCWGEPTLWSMLCRASGLGAIFPRSPIYDSESLGRWQRDSVREVPIISGCFLMITRKLWDELGGFDERFTMYGEEFDLCVRARRLGARPIINPRSKIVHYGGASDKIRSDQTVRQYRGRAMFIKKHWSPGRAWIGVLCLDLWALGKLTRSVIMGVVSRRYSEERRMWWTICRRRKEWWAAWKAMESLK